MLRYQGWWWCAVGLCSSIILENLNIVLLFPHKRGRLGHFWLQHWLQLKITSEGLSACSGGINAFSYSVKIYGISSLVRFYPASQQSSLLGNKNVQVGSSLCAEHGIKAGTDLTSSINPAGFLSFKELPKSAEGHHPPCLPGRFSLWQKRLWSKPHSVNEHILLSGKQMAEMVTVERPETNSVKKQLLRLLETEVSPLSQSSKSHQDSTALPRIQTESVSLMCKAPQPEPVRKKWSWSSFLQFQDQKQNLLQALYTLCI